MPHQSHKYSQDIHGKLEKDIESIVRDLYEVNKESAIHQTIKDAKRTLKRKIDLEYSTTEEETDSGIVDLRVQLEKVKWAKEAETERANRAETEKERAKMAESEMKERKDAETERANRAVVEMERNKNINQLILMNENNKAKKAEDIAIARYKKAESKVKEMTKKRDMHLKRLREKQLELTKAKKDVDFYKGLSQQFQQQINAFNQQIQQISWTPPQLLRQQPPQQPQNTMTDNPIFKGEPESDEEEDSEYYEKSEDSSESEEY